MEEPMKTTPLFLITMLLMVVALTAAHSGTPGRADASRNRPNAQQIFGFVNYVERHPEIDRKMAEAFLQKLLDGKIRFVSKIPTEATAKLPCYQYRYGKLPCVECDAAQETCWSSLCCAAAARKR
jgi:hypothetical protein